MNVHALAAALGRDVGELRALAHGDHYRRWAVPKRAGGERRIVAPSPALRAVQSLILSRLLGSLPAHDAAHGFTRGRSVVTNAAPHVGSACVLTVDVRDFFPSVTEGRLLALFARVGCDGEAARLLARLCTEPGDPRRLPQGAPTSPALSNLVCAGLDRRLARIASRRGWRFTRYADDLTFSSVDAGADVVELLARVREVVRAEGFELREDKTRIARASDRQAVTGLVVNGSGAPRVSRDFKRRLRAALHQCEGPAPADVAGRVAFVEMVEGKR